VYANLLSVLRSRDLDATRIVRQRVFVRDLRDVPVIERVMDHFLDRGSIATSIVQFGDAGVDPRIALQVEAVAVDRQVPQPRPIRDPMLEDALGGYPSAVAAGDFLFLSAISGIHPATGRPAQRLDDLGPDLSLFDTSPYRTSHQHAILAQTWFAFTHIRRICQSVGADLGRILKVTGWLDFPMRDFDPMRPVRQYFFSEQADKVASTALWVGPTPISDALLAYDAICLIGEAEKRVDLDPSLIVSYYVGATAGGGAVFTCGEVPIDEEVPQAVTDLSALGDARRLSAFGRLEALSGIEARAAFVYDKLQDHLTRYGSSLDKVVYQMVFLEDMRQHSPLELVSRAAFGSRVPPTTTVPIRETSPFYSEAKLEIEVVASL
jgi:enamine deaminase RidA (YjgF/YER057c/UK114 family)